jgi:hypothetical protein
MTSPGQQPNGCESRPHAKSWQPWSQLNPCTPNGSKTNTCDGGDPTAGTYTHTSVSGRTGPCESPTDTTDSNEPGNSGNDGYGYE